MDRYIKKKKIGEGSFGTALLVECKSDGKQYVIKEINISKMKKKEKQEAKLEVAVLRKMKHPNIVSYTESFEEVGNLYIVMDYCDGGDLFKQINARRGVLIPEDQIMDWFVQICLALKHVHDRKILHRDIKSQNIFLTRKGIVKVGDFGIARVLNSTMELARTCIGTPYYLSPEIVENRPYNNKSDIWALGCVLYELLTLKHAFEAGNMKNLVLKIIRGSYPPVSPRYTYDIRNLVAQLFKRNPRDRPSINTVLKKPYVRKRIEKFLTDAQMQDEFSHTILHRNMPPPPPRGVQVPRHAPSAGVKRPAEAPRISGPAAKYGPSVARKKPPVAKKSNADRERKSNQADLEQKRKELLEKEQQRRQRDMHFKAQQQRLVEKQKMAHINKAREAGWKTTLSSGNGSNASLESSGALGGGGGGAVGAMEKYGRQYAPKPQPFVGGNKQELGNYDHYHDYLDKLQGEPNVQAGQGNLALFRKDADERREEMEAFRHHAQERPVSASAAEAARRAAVCRQQGEVAAERAQVVGEFISRKREAAANKARVGYQMGWAHKGDVTPDRPEPVHLGDIRPKIGGEQEYLDNLKAIRMQNFRERQLLQQRMAAAGDGKAVKASLQDDVESEAEARRKKISALKAQADERAAKLRNQLEKQRRDAYDREKRSWEEHLARKRNQGKVDDHKRPVPVPAGGTPGLTAVLQDVGASVSAAEVNPQPQEHVQNIQEPQQQEEAQSPPDRKRWGGGDGKGFNLANMPLQETASRMEATSAADIVVKYNNIPTTNRPLPCQEDNMGILHPPEEPAAPSKSPREAPRKKWGVPGNTVVNVLQKKEITPMTLTITKGESDNVLLGPANPMGVTIVKKKGESEKKTVASETMVIKEAEAKVEDDDAVETIEVSGDVNAPVTSHLTSTPKKAWSVEAKSPKKLHDDGDGTDGSQDVAASSNADQADAPKESETPSEAAQAFPSNSDGSQKANTRPIRPLSAPTTKPKYEETDIDMVENDDNKSKVVEISVDARAIAFVTTNAEIKETNLDEITACKESFKGTVITSDKKDEKSTEAVATSSSKCDAGGEQKNANGEQEDADALSSKKSLSPVKDRTSLKAERLTPSPAKAVATSPESCSSSGGRNINSDSKDEVTKQVIRSPGGSDTGTPKLSPVRGQISVSKKTDPDSVSQTADVTNSITSISSPQGGEGAINEEEIGSQNKDEVEDVKKTQPAEQLLVKEVVSSRNDDMQLEADVSHYYEALMNQVDLDSDGDKEEQANGSSDSVDQGKSANNESVLCGLETGIFDADSRLLRTCSLPDLSKLFRTTQVYNPFIEAEQHALAVAVHQTLELANLAKGGRGDDEMDKIGDDDLDDLIDDEEEDENGDDGDDEEEETMAEEDEDEEEAYQSMVESMKHLLEVVDQGDVGDAASNALDEELLRLPSSQQDESSTTGDEQEGTGEDEEEESKPINEDWDSGEGSYNDGDGEDEEKGAEGGDDDVESIFNHLEESRMELEKELGCESFLQAYKSIQAIHEDEDENIEEGSKVVSNILGKSKQHLYPKILQLVMADGAYTEDNE